MNTEQVNTIIEKIKTVHEKVEKVMIFYPWEDVYASMLKEPEKVKVTNRVCPDCGAHLVELYFTSPGWTWEKLCGRAGRMWICPECGNQEDFYLEYMN